MSPRRASGQTYKIVSSPGHPLAWKDGRLLRSRLVLWEKLGGQDAPCHWCGKDLFWLQRSTADALCCDHLDGDSMHDDPDNLVPSCIPCNGHRSDGSGHGRNVEEEELQGLWSSAEHGTVRMYSRGCKCADCLTAMRRYQQDMTGSPHVDGPGWWKYREDSDDGKPPHGHRSRYALGCRCEECKEGNRKWRSDQLQQKLDNGTVVHGLSAYALGCRCDTCRKAKREYNKIYHQHRKDERAALDQPPL